MTTRFRYIIFDDINGEIAGTNDAAIAAQFVVAEYFAIDLTDNVELLDVNDDGTFTTKPIEEVRS